MSPIDLSLQIPITYQDEWHDGFGARGWKLDCATGHSEMIASTSCLGGKSPTSVIVHDVVDHHLSGFGWTLPDEAKAIVIHGLRNGIEVLSSLESLADDLLRESPPACAIEAFLPPEIAVAFDFEGSAHHTKVRLLIEKFERDELRAMLAKQLHVVGLMGIPEALTRWHMIGLTVEDLPATGFAIQRLLVSAETAIDAQHENVANAILEVLPGRCLLVLRIAGRETRFVESAG